MKHTIQFLGLVIFILCMSSCGGDDSENDELDTTDSTVECSWSEFFSDDFNRDDGDLGDKYSVQEVGDGDQLGIFDNKLSVQKEYYSITQNEEVGQLPTRVSIDFTMDTFENLKDLAGIGLGFGQSNSDGSSLGYYCGLYPSASDASSFKLLKIGATPGEPEMDETEYDAKSVTWTPDTNYNMLFTIHNGQLSAILSSEGNILAELSGQDEDPIQTGKIGLSGGHAEFATHFDNLLIEICE